MTLKVTFKCVSDKNFQENINMWPVMPEMDMQSPIPAITRLCCDKNCQSTRCYKKPEFLKHGKNCQSANNMCYDKEI